MISADTSSLSAYFAGEQTRDTSLVEQALSSRSLCISPIVLTELLSDPQSRTRLEPVVSDWYQLAITPGYWIRASKTRARILGLGLRARLPDTFIAQASIDHDVVLITRDPDFRHFEKYCGLKLA